MSNWDDEGARGNNHHRDRDDTPSVIRHVEPFGAVQGRPTAETMPLLEMPKSQKIWRRIRLPIFGTAVAVLLITIGVITRGLMVASTIEKTIRDASVMESRGTLEQTAAAEKTLFTLYEKYSDQEKASAAWAWQTVLESLLWGKPLSEKAKEVIADLDSDDDEFAAAAGAGAALLEGRAPDAARRLEGAPSGPRTTLVKAMALNASGKREEARTALADAMAVYADYIPLTVAAAEAAAEANDQMEVLRLSQQLLKESPTHLVADMLLMRLSLPKWGDPPINPEHLSMLKKKLAGLTARINAAPPKPAVLGRYLMGRIALAEGRADAAARSLEKVLERKKDSETVAYLAEAVRMQSNAEGALKLLEKYETVNGPEIMDIRAQCLLAYHRVRQAEPVVEALRKTGAIPERVQYLQWLLAVRSGNTKAALEYLPKPIPEAEKWVALELYFLLAAAGDHTGITTVADALEAENSSCAHIIHAWHSKALGRALRQFDNSKMSCGQSLIPRLMHRHMEVQAVFQAAEANRKESDGNLIFEVDRARAAWFVEGYDAAVRILDAVASKKPEGAPLLEQLGRAYLELNLPEKVSSLLKDQSHPNLLALRIFALEMQKKKGPAKKLVEKVLVMASSNAHPAIQYFSLRRKLLSGAAQEVRDWVLENPVAETGQWTSELADLGARAMWALEEKVESEKFLQKVARQTLVPGGAGESLDTFMVQVEQNINRAGKYKNHALVVIRTLKEESVKDPRMSYWLAMENITNGSERLGLRLLAEIPPIDPAYKPYYKKLTALERMSDTSTAAMNKMLPGYTP